MNRMYFYQGPEIKKPPAIYGHDWCLVPEGTPAPGGWNRFNIRKMLNDVKFECVYDMVGSLDDIHKPDWDVSLMFWRPQDRTLLDARNCLYWWCIESLKPMPHGKEAYLSRLVKRFYALQIIKAKRDMDAFVQHAIDRGFKSIHIGTPPLWDGRHD